MSRLWPPAVVNQPPVETTLRAVLVQRIPRVREIEKPVITVIAPARFLAVVMKIVRAVIRPLVALVQAAGPLLSPRELDLPPPLSEATA
jgi:hypothetical protein